jgi:hypothetical protein
VADKSLFSYVGILWLLSAVHVFIVSDVLLVRRLWSWNVFCFSNSRYLFCFLLPVSPLLNLASLHQISYVLDVQLLSVLISGQVHLRGAEGVVNCSVCSLMREDASEYLQGYGGGGGNPALDLHDWIISLEASTRDPAYSQVETGKVWIALGSPQSTVTEVGCLLGCNTVQSGRYFLTFQRNLLPPLLKRRSVSTGLRGATSQKTVIFVLVSVRRCDLSHAFWRH